MRHKTKHRAAFTLVELLAAMAVLSVMMLMFANIFTSSGKAWAAGTRRTEQNMGGRAVLEYMCKEIGQSIVDGHTNGLIFKVTASGGLSATSYGLNNSSLSCAAPHINGTNYQDEVALVNYYVVQTNTSDSITFYQLMRAQCTNQTTISQAYLSKPTTWTTSMTTPGWSASVMVDNLTQFYVMVNSNTTFSSANAPYQLPGYVDLFIGFLSEDDMRKLSYLSGATRTAFLNKSEKRFTRRIYMQNRVGCVPVP